MANSKQSRRGPIACPLCGEPVQVDVVERCATCGMDTRDPGVSRILEIDAEWQEISADYGRLMEKLEALKGERQRWIDALLASRVPPEATAGAASAHAGAAPSPLAAPAAQATAAAGPPAPDAVTRLDGQPVPPPGEWPQAAPRAPRRARPRRLTAPNMLGVSGAALLITGAILFVAVTWATFPPVAQAAVVLLVAAGIATLSSWLTERDLPVSGGAVGVAAIAFAGVSVIAIDRGIHILGRLTVAAALAVTVAAGGGDVPPRYQMDGNALAPALRSPRA